MKLTSKYKNAANSVGQWPACRNSRQFINDASFGLRRAGAIAVQPDSPP
jgi:hypothetical protein